MRNKMKQGMQKGMENVKETGKKAFKAVGKVAAIGNSKIRALDLFADRPAARLHFDGKS